MTTTTITSDDYVEWEPSKTFREFELCAKKCFPGMDPIEQVDAMMLIREITREMCAKAKADRARSGPRVKS